MIWGLHPYWFNCNGIHLPNLPPSQQSNGPNRGQTKPDCDNAEDEEEGKSRCGGNARRRDAAEGTGAARRRDGTRKRASEFRERLSCFANTLRPSNPGLPRGPSTSPDGGWKMWDSAVLQMGSKESLGVYLRFSFVFFTLCQSLVIVELSQSLRILRKSFAPHPFTFGSSIG